MTPAEESILGAILNTRGECLPDIVLTADDFSTHAGGSLFALMAEMAEDGTPPDILTVANRISAQSAEDRRGLPSVVQLHEISAAGAVRSSVEYHSQIVAEASARRRLIAAGQWLTQYGTEGMDVDVLADRTLDAVGQAISGVGTVLEPVGVTIAATINSFEEHVTYIETPWAGVNHLIQGWRPGALYVIGARPSVGKTVAGLQAALSLVNMGPVAFVSLEMSAMELEIRMISQEARIDMAHLTRKQLTNEDRDRMGAALQRWESLPLFIDKTHGATFAAVSRHAWSVKRKHGLAALVVDYLQLMESPDSKKNEYQVVTENSRKLKLLAQQLGVPVIALSQLNRGSEQREGKVPQLSDLRASGAVEQDADVVILMHRDLLDNPSELDLIIAKNRHGITGKVEMDFIGHHSHIRDRYGAA